jgi:hypothetical protein
LYSTICPVFAKWHPGNPGWDNYPEVQAEKPGKCDHL